MSILDLPAPTSPTPPPWYHDPAQPVVELGDMAPLVLPAAHRDDSLAGLSPETVELLAAGREAIEAWDAAVAGQRAWEASLAYVPDWAQPMRGAL